MILRNVVTRAIVGSITISIVAEEPDRILLPKTLEHTVVFYMAGDAGPEHTRFKYTDGLWIDVAPLKDSTVVNYFGAYPSLSLFATEVDQLLKTEDAITNEVVPKDPGANSYRYIFGQLQRHSSGRFRGYSFMAQYAQGPGDHSLKNGDLYWSVHGLIYSEAGEKLYVVRGGVDISHKVLESKRPYSDGGNERSKEESCVLDKLDRAGFSPSTENLWERIKATTKMVEHEGAGQPATRSEPDSEGGDKPQHEAEGRSR